MQCFPFNIQTPGGAEKEDAQLAELLCELVEHHIIYTYTYISSSLQSKNTRRCRERRCQAGYVGARAVG